MLTLLTRLALAKKVFDFLRKKKAEHDYKKRADRDSDLYVTKDDLNNRRPHDYWG